METLIQPRENSRSKFLEELDPNISNTSFSGKKSITRRSKTELMDPANLVSKPDLLRSNESSRELPLRNIIVYVEIISNGDNISETTYRHLENLGAKIEKRMNKRCNLVIWKEGTLKTIEKAKEYGVKVVNSVWLEDCMDNNHCADFEKYGPKLPNETDLPFITMQANKKKRKNLDTNNGDTNDENKDSEHKRKKKKTVDKDGDQDKKLELKSACQKKLTELFSSSKSENKTLKRSKTDPERETLFERIGKKKQEENRIQDPEIGTHDFFKGLNKYLNNTNPSNNNLNRSSSQSSTSNSLSIDGLMNKRKEEEQSNKIKSMILTYSRSNTHSLFEKKEMEEEPDPFSSYFPYDETDQSPNRAWSKTIETDKGYSDHPVNRTRSLRSLEINPENSLKPIPEKFEEEEENIPISNILSKYTRTQTKLSENENSRRSDKKSIQKQKSFESDRKKSPKVKPAFENSLKKEPVKLTRSVTKNNEKLLESIEISKGDTSVTKTPQTKSTAQSKPTTISKSAIISKYTTNRRVFDDKDDIESEESEPNLNLERKLNLEPKEDPKIKEEPKKWKSNILNSIFGNKKEAEDESDNAKGSKSKTKKKEDNSQLKSLLNFGFTKLQEKKQEEMLLDERLKINPSTKNMILIGGFKEEHDKTKEFCEKYTDFNLVNDEIRNLQYMSMLLYNGNEIPKTYRTALAMVEGKPIVKCEWIIDSLEENKLKDFQEYMFRYELTPRIAIFKNMRFNIDKDYENLPMNNIGKNEFKKLIEAAGGSVHENVRACDFCVMRKNAKKKPTVPAHVKAITPQWIIDSIIEGKYLSTEHVNYGII